MAKGEFQPPTLTHSGVAGGAEFITGAVPALTPETFNPALATEEIERAEANASEVEGLQQIEELNDMFKLELEGE